MTFLPSKIDIFLTLFFSKSGKIVDFPDFEKNLSNWQKPKSVKLIEPPYVNKGGSIRGGSIRVHIYGVLGAQLKSGFLDWNLERNWSEILEWNWVGENRFWKFIIDFEKNRFWKKSILGFLSILKKICQIYKNPNLSNLLGTPMVTLGTQ